MSWDLEPDETLDLQDEKEKYNIHKSRNSQGFRDLDSVQFHDIPTKKFKHNKLKAQSTEYGSKPGVIQGSVNTSWQREHSGMSAPHQWHHLKSTVVPDFSVVTRPMRKHQFSTELGRHFLTMKHGPTAVPQTASSRQASQAPVPQLHGSTCIRQNLAAFPAPASTNLPHGTLTWKHGSNEGWWQLYTSRPLAAMDTITLWGSKGKETGGHDILVEYSQGRDTCNPRSWEVPAAGGSPLLLFLLTARFLHNPWENSADPESNSSHSKPATWAHCQGTLPEQYRCIFYPDKKEPWHLF